MKHFFLAGLFVLGVLFSASGQMMKTNPYDKLPKTAAFVITSKDALNGKPFHAEQYSGAMGVPGGKDESPELTWTKVPAGTKSFVVTMYDPDAPIVSGFWHWAVVDIPATVTSLPTGAGSPDGKLLPAGAWQLPNDARMAQYVGAAPPKGSGYHRYFIVVTALDVETLNVPKEATPAFLSFNMLGHTLGRAIITPWAEQD